MVIYVEIIDGPQLGERHRLWEGARIGRTTGEIRLNDTKVSSLHAQIEKDAKGGLVLADRDSANGLKISGQKVKRVAMLLGVTFQVGRTSFRVVEVNADEAAPFSEIKPQSRPWKDILTEKVPLRPNKNHEETARVEALRPALHLEFIEGQQLEQRVELGYAPRRFGSDVLDIEIAEPLCPPLAFEILSEEGLALFRTPYPKLVLLNNQPVSEAPLKEGDKIRIGQTLIQVSFAT